MVVKNCAKIDQSILSDIKIHRKIAEQPIEQKSTYDPYHYGNQNHPIMFWGPVLHLFKYIIGVGILTLPHYFRIVGYAVGTVGTIFTGALYIHISHILLDVEYELCKILRVPNLSYIGVIQNSFQKGPKALRKFASSAKFFTYFHYVGNGALQNTTYLIMISNNFKIILDNYFHVDSSITIIATFATIPLVFLACIRNLKFLQPMTVITNIFTFINITSILLISTEYAKIDDLKAINDITQFPRFFGIVISSITGTGILLPLKNEMKNPRQFSSFCGVLQIAVTGSSLLYAAFGFIGYLKFADRIEPTILSNLPANHYLTLIILVLYSISICVSYTLFVYIGFDTIWVNTFQHRKMKHSLLVEYVIRIGLSILPYLVAIVIPNFEIVMSITGVIGILIEIGIPPFLQILLLAIVENKTARVYLVIFKNLVIVAIAFFFFAGGVVNVIKIVNKFFSLS